MAPEQRDGVEHYKRMHNPSVHGVNVAEHCQISWYAVSQEIDENTTRLDIKIESKFTTII